MPRKRNQSPLEVFIDLVALFPWWVGLILAVVSYFWLHHVASAPLMAPGQPGQIGAAVSQGMYKALATAGQYIVPLVCVLGALFSVLGRTKRAMLFADASKRASVSAINEMTWQEFEMLVGEAFRRGGYSVAETGGGGADGGVDLVLRKDGEKFLVQCKQWRAYKVGVSIIRELYGVMAAEGAAGGFVVTSGVFTQEAKSFAEGRNIDLIDGAELMEIIKEIQFAATPTIESSSQFATAAPDCPKCGGAMVKRLAQQGANAGRAFWGCNSYPQCRGIVPIDCPR